MTSHSSREESPFLLGRLIGYHRAAAASDDVREGTLLTFALFAIGGLVLAGNIANHSMVRKMAQARLKRYETNIQLAELESHLREQRERLAVAQRGLAQMKEQSSRNQAEITTLQRELVLLSMNDRKHKGRNRLVREHGRMWNRSSLYKAGSSQTGGKFGMSDDREASVTVEERALANRCHRVRRSTRVLMHTKTTLLAAISGTSTILAFAIIFWCPPCDVQME